MNWFPILSKGEINFGLSTGGSIEAGFCKSCRLCGFLFHLYFAKPTAMYLVLVDRIFPPSFDINILYSVYVKMHSLFKI